MSSVHLHVLTLCRCVIRHEIQRLLDEREVLLSSFGVSQSSFTSGTDPVVQDLSAMLTCKDKIDEELKAEEAQIASLKDQVKGVLPWTICRMQHSELLLI